MGAQSLLLVPSHQSNANPTLIVLKSMIFGLESIPFKWGSDGGSPKGEENRNSLPDQFPPYGQSGLQRHPISNLDFQAVLESKPPSSGESGQQIEKLAHCLDSNINIVSQSDLLPRQDTLCETCQAGAFTTNASQDPNWIITALTSQHPKYTSANAFYHASDAGKVRYRFKHTISSLESTSSLGCLWCQLVLSLLAEHRDRVSIVSAEVVLDFYRLNEHDNYGLRNGQIWKITLLTKTADTRPTGLPATRHFIPYVDHGKLFYSVVSPHIKVSITDDPLAAIVAARSRIVEVASYSVRELGLHHIEDCALNHRKYGCYAPSESSVLPTRVVDCTNSTYPRLVNTNGVTGKYVALSYVWGQDQPHKTTTRNLTSYLSRIDSSFLPQTIQDAIVFTQSLGIQYLWVDTLCIIQDSATDKAQQLGSMSEIYNNAHVTIIAASALNASEGFLQKRPLSQDRYLPVKSNDGDRVGKLRLWQPTYKASPESVDTRAWCFQERVLSPRAIVFASTTVEFHCNKGPTGLGNSILRESIAKDRLPGILLQPHIARSTAVLPYTEDALRVAWFRSLNKYTSLSLTDPSDKLVAFSAVARRFSRVLRADYVAGLWRPTLMKDLLWSVDCTTVQPRPAVWRAPSWSWAAVDGSIESWETIYSEESDLTLRNILISPVVKPKCFAEVAEVIRCDATVQSEENTFGAVTSGTLVLRAPMMKASARRLTDPGTFNPYMGVMLLGEDGSQITLPERAGHGKPDSFGDWFVSDFSVALLWVERQEQDADSESPQPVGANEDSSVPTSAFSSAYGLMLCPEMNGAQTKYRRIGVIHVVKLSPVTLYRWNDRFVSSSSEKLSRLQKRDAAKD
ncbi:hypothetical protein HGRIS_010122 [Hohenbuehelia grisea]|uniref:Heterokaryon incompatibility domain-containing protein n=1 Tax=Hohenbuehelia grisea TaxID=104357 RepID=A0ABR3J3W5_9AGAR